MLAQLRSSLTYANMMATVAVFVALGGTSYAVATGSVDSREIKNNAVRSKDIRNNNVSTRDLKNNSARGGDVRNNSLTGDDVLESSLGTVPRANSADTAARAETLVPNSVGTDQIQANAVTMQKLADGAVDSTKVKSGEFVESCGPGSTAAVGSWFAPSLPTDGSFVPPNRFGGELGFACAGSGLTATKLAMGHYRIQTNGLGSALLIQLANAEPGTGQTRFASSSGPFAGDIFDVFVRDAAGTLSDPSYVSLVLIQTG